MPNSLTTDQRERLADIVVDPDAWWAHVQATFTPEKARASLDSKLSNPEHVREYEARKAMPTYKNRAVRDAEERAALDAQVIVQKPELTAQDLASLLIGEGVLDAKKVEDFAKLVKG